MKTAFIILSLILISGCSKSPPAPAMSKGLELAEKSQCLPCHALEAKVIGPSWKAISTKYNEEIRSGKAGRKEVEAMLEKKIAMGGKGNWTGVTGGMSMPPSYPRVSKENIGKLVHFILSLKE